MNSSPWSALLSVGFSTFPKYPNFHDFCKDNLVAFQHANPRFDRAKFDAACGLDDVRKSRELSQAA
jgi:hypothetical protein